jgi:hypothetical protein
MKTTTYHFLRRLHERHGARTFGKLCQKLVALAYRRGGCSHVVERGVQGVDIDSAWGPDHKFATEIKTTEKTCVAFLAKDVAGLASRQRDGYQPLLGVLRLSPLSVWFLVDATGLKSRNWDMEALRPHRRLDMEAHLEPLFAIVVEQHFEGALAGSQNYLDQKLRQMGVQTLPKVADHAGSVEGREYPLPFQNCGDA